MPQLETNFDFHPNWELSPVTTGEGLRQISFATPAAIAYEKSFAQLRLLDARHDLATMLLDLGRACLFLGDTGRAGALFRESLVLYHAGQNREGMADCLIGLGSVAVMQGMPKGVRLLVAAKALCGQRNAYMWAAKSKEVEPYLELARAHLSQTELQAEQAAGHALSLEQAVQDAQDLPLMPSTPRMEEEMSGLTRREYEVANLVKRGLSNREIANELVLSTRTVEKHVANILAKLGMNCRAQIVRWAMEHVLQQDFWIL